MSISREQFMNYYVERARMGNVSLFLGAGVSASAGLPSWTSLLEPCAKQIGLEIDNNMDLYLLAQYYANEYGYSALKRAINDSVNQLDNGSNLVDTLLELNFKSIWTTNYDKVIENSLVKKRVPMNSIHGDKDLPNTTGNSRINIYKMHGDITNLDRIVITQKDLEAYQQNHEMLLTFFKRELVVNTFLFLGYSFTDTMVLSCLTSVNHCLGDSANSHFAILKKKNTKDFPHFITNLEKRYNIRILLINDYDELPSILQELKERITQKNIFFSGVFERLNPQEDEFAEQLCKKLTDRLLRSSYHIYTGYGRNFGNYLCGSSIQFLLAHNMEVDRYLIMRPFLRTMSNDEKAAHRKMLILECKYAIFMFGQSPVNGKYVNATGMWKEFNIAREEGKIVIPVGCTGYTAHEIWNEIKNNLTHYPYLEKYIDMLGGLEGGQDIGALVEAIFQIIENCS